MKLSEHFDSYEFDCHCCGCGGHGMHPQLISGVEMLRRMIGGPIRIVSGFRCRFHNDRVNGMENSRHLFGEAADILLPEGLNMDQFFVNIRTVSMFDYGGIGRYEEKEFIHVDVRWVSGMPKARW